jgi:hypothetical protein
VSAREERIAELSARAELDRAELADALSDVRVRLEEKRARWTSRGFWAGTIAAGAVSAYRMLHRDSFTSKVERWSSAAAVTLTVARFLGRLIRFF